MTTQQLRYDNTASDSTKLFLGLWLSEIIFRSCPAFLDDGETVVVATAAHRVRATLIGVVWATFIGVLDLFQIVANGFLQWALVAAPVHLFLAVVELGSLFASSCFCSTAFSKDSPYFMVSLVFPIWFSFPTSFAISLAASLFEITPLAISLSASLSLPRP